jgi:excisionase family DNA binding protein
MPRCPSLCMGITLYDALPYGETRSSVLRMTQRTTDDTKPLVFLEEAAVILGVSKDTVVRGSKNGSIPFVRFSARGQRRYDPDVLRTIRARAEHPQAESA